MPGLVMNGSRARQPSLSSASEPRYGAGLQGIYPGTKVLVDGYKGSLRGANNEYQRYGVVRYSGNVVVKIYADDCQLDPNEAPQRLPLLNKNDPVTMHLLLETAMGDSQHFQALSQEELDASKKELSILATRIDGTRRKLVLETKLCDAAQSLSRLQDSATPDMSDSSPNPGKRPRRSMMGSRGSFSEMLNKTDDELADSSRKCDNLAQELWHLEKRAESLQKKLLEHTAGVLQMTHKGYLEKDFPSTKADSANNQINGQSPPKLFDVDREFDDSSFYQTLDTLLDTSGYQANASRAPSMEDLARCDQAILETERRLQDFNNRLRVAIAQLSLHNGATTAPPVQRLQEGQDPLSGLDDQMVYLERSIATIQRDRDAAEQDNKHSLHATVERLSDFNSQLSSLITRGHHGQRPEHVLPPQASGEGPDAQMDYMEAGLDVVAQSIQRLTEDNRTLSSIAADSEEANHYKTVLLGLWEILVGGEEDLRRQDPVHREVLVEDFSLQSFSNRVQTLFARVTGLQEQKETLARQVQQQRELNTQSDSTKDAKISEMTLELDHARGLITEQEHQVTEARDNLALVTERLDFMRQEVNLLEQQKGMNKDKAFAAEKLAWQELEQRLLAELSEKQNQLTTVESRFAETKDDHGISSAEMLGRLEESEKRIEALNSELKASTIDREKSQQDAQDLEGQFVLLQTELTVAKAELDAAYGTRAERAAEATANPAKQQEFDELVTRNQRLTEEIDVLRNRNVDVNQRAQTLQRELTETIGEYETMTQSTITYERDREQLENSVDSLRDRCEALETQLSEEKVRWLGVKSPGSGGAIDFISPGTTSTQVLKNEFKKMMRDTRAENMRALRVS